MNKIKKFLIWLFVDEDTEETVKAIEEQYDEDIKRYFREEAEGQVIDKVVQTVRKFNKR